MLVQSLLQQKSDGVLTIAPEETLSECIELLQAKRIGALLVVDQNGRTCGIVSERDILRAADEAGEKMFDMLVRDVMTPADKLITASPQETIAGVMEYMTENRIRHLPIMHDGRPVGMISIGDVVKTLLDQVQHENQQLLQYISGRYP